MVSYDEVIANREDFVDAWYQKGQCLGELNLEQEAIAAYDQTLKLQPDSHLPWIGKGNVLSRSQRFQEALDCYEKAVSLNSGDRQASAKIDAMLEELQKLESEGERLLQEAINLTNLKQYEEAMNIYDQALNLIGKNLISA